jgi:hypothetical protein
VVSGGRNGRLGELWYFWNRVLELAGCLSDLLVEDGIGGGLIEFLGSAGRLNEAWNLGVVGIDKWEEENRCGKH